MRPQKNALGKRLPSNEFDFFVLCVYLFSEHASRENKGSCHPVHFLDEPISIESLRDENVQGQIILYISLLKVWEVCVEIII